MAIEGPIRELALTDVLQLLGLSRKTGELGVRRDGASATVYLDQGFVVGARADAHTRRLGELLLLAGKVTESQLAAAAATQRAGTQARLGAILADEHGVSPDEIRRRLRFQVEEIVFDLVRWQDGEFRFEERPTADWGPITIRVPTEGLLMEAARRVDELAALAGSHGEAELVPRLNEQPSAGAPVSLQPLEWEVLGEIDGERDLGAIAREVGRGEFEVAKSVFALVSEGIVALGKPQSARPRAADEQLSRAREALESGRLEEAGKLLAGPLANGATGEVLVLAGRIEAARGRWAEAAERFARAVERDPLLAPAYLRLGAAAARTGRLEQAEDALRTGLRLAGPSGKERAAFERLAHAIAGVRSALREVEG